MSKTGEAEIVSLQPAPEVQFIYCYFCQIAQHEKSGGCRECGTFQDDEWGVCGVAWPDGPCLFEGGEAGVTGWDDQSGRQLLCQPESLAVLNGHGARRIVRELGDDDVDTRQLLQLLFGKGSLTDIS